MVKTRGGGSSNHKPNEPNKHAEYSGGGGGSGRNIYDDECQPEVSQIILTICQIYCLDRILTHNKQYPIPYPIHQFHHGGRCVRTLSSLRVGVSSCTRVHANTRALRTPSAQKQTPFLPLFLLLTFLSFLFFSSSSFTQANHGTVNSHTRGRQRTRDHALHVQRCAFSVRQWEQ